MRKCYIKVTKLCRLKVLIVSHHQIDGIGESAFVIHQNDFCGLILSYAFDMMDLDKMLLCRDAACKTNQAHAKCFDKVSKNY